MSEVADDPLCRSACRGWRKEPRNLQIRLFASSADNNKSGHPSRGSALACLPPFFTLLTFSTRAAALPGLPAHQRQTSFSLSLPSFRHLLAIAFPVQLVSSRLIFTCIIMHPNIDDRIMYSSYYNQS